MIEKLDKTRYNLFKWGTIGWTIWFGTYILKDLIKNRLIILILVFIGLIGAILWALNLIRLMKLGKKVNSDNRLKEALNNEMHQLYALKASRWGFVTLIFTIGIFLGISSFFKISALIVCEITLYIGVLSSFIASLIYNKG